VSGCFLVGICIYQIDPAYPSQSQMIERTGGRGQATHQMGSRKGEHQIHRSLHHLVCRPPLAIKGEEKEYEQCEVEPCSWPTLISPSWRQWGRVNAPYSTPSMTVAYRYPCETLMSLITCRRTGLIEECVEQRCRVCHGRQHLGATRPHILSRNRPQVNI